MKILLSIKEEFAEKILTGEKKFEYRKIQFRRPINTVLLYCTMPVGKIIGEFQIEEILSGSPSEIWKQTKKHSGISKDYFDQYFHSREKAVAIRIKSPKRYRKSIDPHNTIDDFQAPQSFSYVN